MKIEKILAILVRHINVETDVILEQNKYEIGFVPQIMILYHEKCFCVLRMFYGATHNLLLFISSRNNEIMWWTSRHYISHNKNFSCTRLWAQANVEVFPYRVSKQILKVPKHIERAICTYILHMLNGSKKMCKVSSFLSVNTI